MNGELLEHLPKSFQIMARIEAEAQKRAEVRFREILRRNEKI